MNKIQKLKEIVKELDVIPYWNENKTSNTLKRIINKKREIREISEEKEAEIIKLAEKLKHRIWVLVNKTPYVVEEKEKVKLNNIFDELGKIIGKKE